MTPHTVHELLIQLDLVGRYLRAGCPRDALCLLQGVEQELQRMMEEPVRVGGPEPISAAISRVVARIVVTDGEDD
jgi:hypothetical protein